MVDPQSFHMTAEEFRRHGKEVVDWIADYYERVETLPVLSQEIGRASCRERV